MLKEWLDSIFDHGIGLQERLSKRAALISILLLIILPVCFFVCGGMEGGASQWFVLCFIYISTTLRGKRKWIFFLLCAADTILCHYLAWRYPEFVARNSESLAYFESAVSIILVGGLASILLIFLKNSYEEENKVTRQQKKEIEELNEAENNFFSSMSHEIRTPVNTIIGLNEIILREAISEEVAESARNIQGAGKLLLTLINDILDLSKINSGKMEIVNVSYDTREFFTDIINMIWVNAKGKGLGFQLHVDPAIPSGLWGDEVRIKQIMINLLTNAVKYTNEGEISFSVRCERREGERVRIWYSVTDTGQGVKKENIPYLFNAFKRVEEGKNRHIEGTGLGLSIVRQMVDLMGGEISVDSVYTKGSTFTVMLEQGIRDEKELGTFTLDSRVRTNIREKYQQSFEAPEARLLIVDDNEMNLKVASRLLFSTGIQIDTALGGGECLKLTRDRHYDCILMDHLMPGMDGIECLHALRAQPGGMCRETPVIVLTANAGSDNQLLYQKEGFSGYLAKPVSGVQLEAAVLKILPRELVEISEEEDQPEIGKTIQIFGQENRKPLLITTDSVCDLPPELAEQLGISVCPYYVRTEEGRFLDGKEIKPDELLVYLSVGKKGFSHAPETEDYENFFAQKLMEAQNVIHITMARYSSEGYHNACEAARSFENVTVLDSGHLSSSMGLLVLYAAHMARNQAGKQQIMEAVEKLKDYISSAFILDSTHMLCRAGKIPKNVRTICDALLLHPVIVLRKSKMTVGGIHIGSFRHVMKSYIRKMLKNAGSIDRRILFITYAGMDEESLLYIQELVGQYCPFERIYVQKASSAIASNCGPGSFGLLFMKKLA